MMPSGDTLLAGKTYESASEMFILLLCSIHLAGHVDVLLLYRLLLLLLLLLCSAMQSVAVAMHHTLGWSCTCPIPMHAVAMQAVAESWT